MPECRKCHDPEVPALASTTPTRSSSKVRCARPSFRAQAHVSGACEATAAASRQSGRDSAVFVPYTGGRHRLPRHHPATIEPPVWLRMDFALAKDDSRSVGMHKQKVRACLPTNVQGLREHKRDDSLRIQSTFVMQSSAMPEIARCRRVKADVGKSLCGWNVYHIPHQVGTSCAR